MNAQVVPRFEKDLRQLNFPANVKEVLGKLDEFYVACKHNGVPWNPDVLFEEINLFVFNLDSSLDLKRTKLRAVHQLHLANIILEFLALPRDGNDRMALFKTIFYSTNLTKGDVPLQILKLMASQAVIFRFIEILDTLALWISAAGLENPSVILIAQHLSNDFATDEFSDHYDYLPQQAYQFTVVLIGAIAKAYTSTPPPKYLILQVATWIESTPRLCLNTPQPTVFDLFRWCIITIEETKAARSKLHLALMTAISTEGKGTQLHALREIKELIQELKVKRESTLADNYYGEVLTHETLEAIVDMLLQLLQMLILAECLGVQEIHNIFDTLEGPLLPRTELHKMLKAQHLKQLFYTFREPKKST